MEYKTVNIDELRPYDKNPRLHSAYQIQKIANSLNEFGFINPILIDSENQIIAGHGRLEAAKLIGLESVPVLYVDHLTDAQQRAYVIADNKLALDATWDDDFLRVEIDELLAIGFDVELTGFTLDEIGVFDAEEVEMPVLASGDKEPYQQKTFTLHDEQASIVDDAIMLARASPLVDTGINENSNGNALALICRQWLNISHE